MPTDAGRQPEHRGRPGALGVLKAIDGGLARVEAFLLSVHFFGLVAGGIAQVIQQNVPPGWIGRGAEGLAGAGGGAGSWDLLSAIAGTSVALLASAGALALSGRRRVAMKVLVIGLFIGYLRGALYLEGGIDYVLRASVLWIGLIGASLATRQRKHITIEALEKFCPERIKRLSTVLTSATAIAILVVLFRVSLEYVGGSRERGEVFFNLRKADFAMPEWWVKLILPIGLGLLCWRFTLVLLEALADVVPPGVTADESPRDELEAGAEEGGSA